ncbi:pimeloyl-ACP methyl ester carboxylesterase [Antricoccus suffuscus]|uniref:Pimeloyl-ACP methyl ester carboxylesterase n=1 Tax=Antricoccus suffuscus TaxID=1629062 RepID=A0A2T1A374_9ACTN|nr:alpha/beta hydrolase [Antricoccus suffuscus]PRZ43059.1 pimeloyl-ACP methyl ester carboxylesterase [Antricoccus suffuscus]
MADTVASADGTPIAYQSAGAGDALILTVGALSASQSVGPLVDLLADQFTVYRYDRRGRGSSGDSTSYSVAREVEDLRAVLQVTGGSANLYGHSSGGILALRAAHSTPGFAKVAVYEPPFCVEPKPGFPEHIEKLLADDNRDEAVAEWMRSTGAPYNDGWKHAPFWPSLVALAHTLPYDLRLAGDGTVPSEELAHISAETLALYGGDSQGWALESATAVAAAIPGARAKMVPGQGHPVAHEVVAPILADFFLQ